MKYEIFYLNYKEVLTVLDENNKMIYMGLA